MKAKQLIALAAAALLLCGCSAEPAGGSDSDGFFGYPDSAPYGLPTGTPAPDTPYLQYLGSIDISKTEAAGLYLQNYSDGETKNIFECEFVTPQNLSVRLSERISSDLTPDLCDKLSNSYPYLMTKNLYEDLTAYIDLTAPQWVDYAGYIESFSIGSARYFYPTSVTVSPNVLLYDKAQLSGLGLDDPAELWKNGEWNRANFSKTLSRAPGIGGANVLENLLAGSGLSLITTDSSVLSLHIGDESFLENSLFANKNYFDVSTVDNYLILPNREYCSFVSIDDAYLAKLRAAYPDEDFGIVPYPLDENAKAPAYLVLSEGFLVPRRAKNIKGAASFINCSRIVAQSSEASFPDSLKESDIEILTALRQDTQLPSIIIESLCLDASSNEATGRMLSEIYTHSALSDNWEQILREYGTPLNKAISEINAG